MSDEVSKHFEANSKPQEEATAGRSISFTITLHPNGQIDFQIPSNKVIAYGLLGAANEQLTKMSLMQEMKQELNHANGGGINGLLKRMGGR